MFPLISTLCTLFFMTFFCFLHLYRHHKESLPGIKLSFALLFSLVYVLLFANAVYLLLHYTQLWIHFIWMIVIILVIAHENYDQFMKDLLREEIQK